MRTQITYINCFWNSDNYEDWEFLKGEVNTFLTDGSVFEYSVLIPEEETLCINDMNI